MVAQYIVYMTTNAGLSGSTDVFDAYRALHRALSRAVAQAFSDTGVGPQQVHILREIRSSKKVSQVDLCHATSTDPAGMMRSLDALESRGWLQRVGCEDDRRRKLVSLTAEGQRAITLLDAHYDTLREFTNRALSTPERKQFCVLVGKIAVTLEAAAPPALAEEKK